MALSSNAERRQLLQYFRRLPHVRMPASVGIDREEIKRLTADLAFFYDPERSAPGVVDRARFLRDQIEAARRQDRRDEMHRREARLRERENIIEESSEEFELGTPREVGKPDVEAPSPRRPGLGSRLAGVWASWRDSRRPRIDVGHPVWDRWLD